MQTVDEGNALYVRGGDWQETKVFVNDALLLSGFRYDNPTGTFTNTPNAFLLDGIYSESLTQPETNEPASPVPAK